MPKVVDEKQRKVAISVTIPAGLLEEAAKRGINVSQAAAEGIRLALDRGLKKE